MYDYLGALVARWPHGKQQRPAVTGSVIRTTTHSNGASPAGYVASFSLCAWMDDLRHRDIGRDQRPRKAGAGWALHAAGVSVDLDLGAEQRDAQEDPAGDEDL